MSSLVEKPEKKSESYRVSKDGKSYEVDVEEIENGYLVCIYESWYEGEGDKKEYKSNRTKTYYKENPFGESIAKKEKEDKIDPLKGLQEFMQKMSPIGAKY